MDVLKDKKYESYDYISRYTSSPYYYHTIDEREIYGLSSNITKTTSWVAHKVGSEDTLDSLSLKYYNNPTYWWVIAMFNDIQDPFIKLTTSYNVIKIPAINGIAFGDER